jgi:hypothetical protein
LILGGERRWGRKSNPDEINYSTREERERKSTTQSLMEIRRLRVRKSAACQKAALNPKPNHPITISVWQRKAPSFPSAAPNHRSVSAYHTTRVASSAANAAYTAEARTSIGCTTSHEQEQVNRNLDTLTVASIFRRSGCSTGNYPTLLKPVSRGDPQRSISPDIEE